MFEKFPDDIISILPDNFFSKILVFQKLLLDWNQKINLIGKSTEKNIMNRHVLDSVQLVKYFDKNDILIDLGSGAGFPGLILSYAGVKQVFLIEANKKKASFLKEASLISDDKIHILNERCENIIGLQGDVITARAFSNMINIFEWSKNLRKVGTKYLLLRGKNVDMEQKELEKHFKCSTWNIPSVTNNESSILLIKDVVKRNSYD